VKTMPIKRRRVPYHVPPKGLDFVLLHRIISRFHLSQA
jgi:hypothetical protein